MIQLQISTVIVYCSNNYADFRMMNGNRSLNDSKIKRIKDDIMKGIDVLKYCPILVKNDGKRLDIIDGQHRFWVSKNLKRPVHFIIADKDMDLYSIASINSNSENWKIADYINCYKQLGNTNYHILESFMEKYKLQATVSQNLLSKGKLSSDNGYGDRSKSFERGKFEVKEYDKAVATAEAIHLFKVFPQYRTRTFCIAISMILEAGKCDMAELADKVNKSPEDLVPQANQKQYIYLLEQIYNKNKRDRRYIS